MFVSHLVFKLFALLVVFFPWLSVIFAQEDEEGDSSSSSLLVTNYNALRDEGQGFYLRETSMLYEKPGSATTSFVGLYWWCDFEFLSDHVDSDNYGYVGRAVGYILGSSLENIVAQGAQMSTGKKNAYSVSAVMVPTLGIFEGQIHKTNDDLVFRYWDDGSSTLPTLVWEGHDEGDTHPNSDTSAFSAIGSYTKITTEAAAEMLGMGVADMTPATCSTEYEAAWNATHVPDPIDTSVTDLEYTVAQLEADNKELLSRIVAIEGSLTASSSDDGEATATSSSSPFMAAFENATTDMVMKSILTVAIIISLVAVDFIW